MAFKVKNLLISVLPNAEEKSLPGLTQAQDQACNFLGHQLPPPSCLVFSIPICLRQSMFPLTPPSSDMPSDPETLAILKGHLQEALASVQVQEQKVNEQMAPQTVEEAQALENHLSTALEEVRQQKEKLQNKATGGQG